MTLRRRIWVIIITATLGVLLLSSFGLYSLHQTMMAERHAQIDRLLILAQGLLEHYQGLEASGKLTHEEAQARAKDALAGLRRGDDYFFARTRDNIMLVHPDAKRIGKFDKGSKSPDGRWTSEIYADIFSHADRGTSVIYVAKPGDKSKVLQPKLNGVALFQPWQWIVGIGFFVDDVDSMFWRYAFNFMLIGGVLLLVDVGITVTTGRSILKQLGGEPQYAADIAGAIDITGAIAAGNLAQEIQLLGGDNSLLAAMSRMQGGLRAFVQRFNEASAILVRASAELTEQMHNISRGAEAAASATSSTVATVEEMAVSIDQVNHGAQETETSSRHSATLASEGEQLAGRVLAENQKIAADVSVTSELIRGLVKSSREIDSIASAIKDIAGQTNLLALNAAIEAARAGEQGRGFAVVADEVRKLAERTTSATQDIAHTTETVQRDVDTAASKMDDVGQLVRAGLQQTERTAKALGEIRDSVDCTLGQVNTVARAMQEQTQASSRIASNIEQISQMAEESGASISSALLAVSRLDTLARDLREAAAQFRLQ
jgi:methyl-accepting chemotaxis protein/methyl-accepting chemotaxis protein-3 (ribose and galactose sensor receptor)